MRPSQIWTRLVPALAALAALSAVVYVPSAPSAGAAGGARVATPALPRSAATPRAVLTEQAASRCGRGRTGRCSSRVRLFTLRRWGSIRALIAGPDGRLWLAADRYTPRAEDATPIDIISMTTRGRARVMATVGQTSVSLATGPDGNVWAAAALEGPGDSGRILRITPSAQMTSFDAGLPPEGLPASLATGADGNLWFTLGGSSEKVNFEIGRITPSGEITRFSSRIAGLARQYPPLEITAGRDGAMWFTTNSGYTLAGCAYAETPIGRISSAGEVSRATDALLEQPFPFLSGPDDEFWIGEACPDRLTRLGPTDGALKRMRLPAEVAALTAGPGGRPWFTDAGPAIGLITTGGRILRRRLPLGLDRSAGTTRGPFLGQGLAYGSDGHLWVATVGGSNRAVLARYRP